MNTIGWIKDLDLRAEDTTSAHPSTAEHRRSPRFLRFESLMGLEIE
jgi:hypothetical protein